MPERVELVEKSKNFNKWILNFNTKIIGNEERIGKSNIRLKTYAKSPM